MDLPWTILPPVYFMDKLLHPQAAGFHWRVMAHVIGTQSRLQVIACEDIAAFAALASSAPAATR